MADQVVVGLLFKAAIQLCLLEFSRLAKATAWLLVAFFCPRISTGHHLVMCLPENRSGIGSTAGRELGTQPFGEHLVEVGRGLKPAFPGIFCLDDPRHCSVKRGSIDGLQPSTNLTQSDDFARS